MKRPKRILKIVLLVCGVMLVGFFFIAYGNSTNAKKEFEKQLTAALITNRARIITYFDSFKEYPILEDGQIHFWVIRANQYIWLKKFDGLTNVATNPIAEEMRNHSWTIHEKASDTWRRPNAEDLKKMFCNPLSGKFDWLAEGVDGKLYSPEMPRETLLATPPIRIKNIRCPSKASDPPYFEDYIKW